MRNRLLRYLAASVLLLLFTLPADAIVVADGGNTTAPADDPGFDRVGTFSYGSGVYLGNGWVLTARHVSGLGSFSLDGQSYNRVNGTGRTLDNSFDPNLTALSDLYLAQYDVSGSSIENLPLLNISQATPSEDDPARLIGAGKTQTASTPTLFYADEDPDPWDWDDQPFAAADSIRGGFYATGPRGLRWADAPVGVNGDGDVQFATFLDFDGTSIDADQVGFLSDFEDLPDHGMAANNDSGSGVFIERGGQWELVGITHAISTFSGQLKDPDLDGDDVSPLVFGNQTFHSDLSVYADQIIPVIPEPASALLLAGLGLPWLGRRRQ
jgi:hypothetical protein